MAGIDFLLKELYEYLEIDPFQENSDDETIFFNSIIKNDSDIIIRPILDCNIFK